MMIRYWCVVVFFFQAEDGIRDLVRSRGLGDVYKRQLILVPLPVTGDAIGRGAHLGLTVAVHAPLHVEVPVSYTHLTLPTSDLV